MIFSIPLVEFLGAHIAYCEDRIDLLEQFTGVEGLGHPAVGAAVHRALDVCLGGVAGDDQDADMPRLGIGADQLAYAEAVEIGHHKVENDQIGAELHDLEAGLKTVAGDAQRVGHLFALEGTGDQLEDAGLVIDDEDASLIGVGGCVQRRHVVHGEEVDEVFHADAPVAPRGLMGFELAAIDPICHGLLGDLAMGGDITGGQQLLLLLAILHLFQPVRIIRHQTWKFCNYWNSNYGEALGKSRNFKSN